MVAKLVVVGGGRMGTALVGGLLRSGWAQPSELVVAEADDDRRRGLAAELPGVGIEPGPVSAEGAVVAVKPGDAREACEALASVASCRTLSIMAGVSISRIESWLGTGVPVVRAMPNTPAVVGAGASAIAGGTVASENDMAWAESVLGAVGVVVRVAEGLLDGVTGLSGSGPAYVFMVAEALVEAGVLVGLPRTVSRALALQTIVGSARLLSESGEEPEVLRAQVTSPGGTTAAGLRALEARAVRSAFIEAVAAAAERSRQLG